MVFSEKNNKRWLRCLLSVENFGFVLIPTSFLRVLANKKNQKNKTLVPIVASDGAVVAAVAVICL